MARVSGEIDEDVHLVRGDLPRRFRKRSLLEIDESVESAGQTTAKGSAVIPTVRIAVDREACAVVPLERLDDQLCNRVGAEVGGKITEGDSRSGPPRPREHRPALVRRVRMEPPGGPPARTPSLLLRRARRC